MASKYKDDSVVPEPPREGVGDLQDSQNQHEPNAASANLAAPQPAKPIFGRRPTLGDLIGWYAGSILQANQRRHGSHRHLVSLTVHPIARKVADKLIAAALVRHAQDRRGLGTSPLTIAVDFNLIHAVLEAARCEGLIALDLSFFKEARRQCRQDQLIVYRAKAPPRVTDQELSDLTVYFARDRLNDLLISGKSALLPMIVCTSTSIGRHVETCPLPEPVSDNDDSQSLRDQYILDIYLD